MKIQYPVFLQCIVYTSESFWKNIFEDLAYGVCPSGVSLRDDVIYIMVNNTHFNFKFSDYTVEELFKLIKDSFHKNLNIAPKSDKIKQRYHFYQFLQNKKYESWSSIRKKNTKVILIKNYVIMKKIEYDLTINQMKKLLSLITIGFHFKLLTPEDIDYDIDTCQITAIRGIEISTKRIILHKVFKASTMIETPSSDSITMKSLWDKYLTQL